MAAPHPQQQKACNLTKQEVMDDQQRGPVASMCPLCGLSAGWHQSGPLQGDTASGPESLSPCHPPLPTAQQPPIDADTARHAPLSALPSSPSSPQRASTRKVRALCANVMVSRPWPQAHDMEGDSAVQDGESCDGRASKRPKHGRGLSDSASPSPAQPEPQVHAHGTSTTTQGGRGTSRKVRLSVGEWCVVDEWCQAHEMEASDDKHRGSSPPPSVGPSQKRRKQDPPPSSCSSSSPHASIDTSINQSSPLSPTQQLDACDDPNPVYWVRTRDGYTRMRWHDIRPGLDHPIATLMSVGVPLMHVDYLLQPSFTNAPRQRLEQEHFRAFHTFDKVSAMCLCMLATSLIGALYAGGGCVTQVGAQEPS